MAETRTTKMVYGMFSGDDGADVGHDNGTNVSLDYEEGSNGFTGKINKVTISVE